MPAALKQLVSVYLLLAGLAVAVQFIIFPFYEDHDTDLLVWRVLDWFMAAGLLLAVLGTFLRKREFDASAGDDVHWRDYIEVNGLFYCALALTLAFLPAWFWAEWGANPERADWVTWHVIDTVLPILFVALGLRFWREANA